MKCSNAEKYLGNILSINMASSVLETIKKRISLANKAIYEIRFVLDDKRVNHNGGMTLGFDIFETCIIPFLLHNAETFVGISSKALKLLDKVSLRYLRLVLSVGTGCPIPILYTETNTLLMSTLSTHSQSANVSLLRGILGCLSVLLRVQTSANWSLPETTHTHCPPCCPSPATPSLR